MFGTQNLTTTVFPCGYAYHTFCGYVYHTFCGYSYCPYFYNTIHCPYGTLYLPQVQCPGGASIPAQVGPGDPVEGLRALRQQLEVTLAGVRAQEEELQRQRAAASREGA
jgi:hypothetical protein